MGKVTVYKVQLYDALDYTPLISTRMATLKGAHIMGGGIVEGAASTLTGRSLSPARNKLRTIPVRVLGLKAKKRRT